MFAVRRLPDPHGEERTVHLSPPLSSRGYRGFLTGGPIGMLVGLGLVGLCWLLSWRLERVGRVQSNPNPVFGHGHVFAKSYKVFRAGLHRFNWRD